MSMMIFEYNYFLLTYVFVLRYIFFKFTFTFLHSSTFRVQFFIVQLQLLYHCTRGPLLLKGGPLNCSSSHSDPGRGRLAGLHREENNRKDDQPDQQTTNDNGRNDDDLDDVVLESVHFGFVLFLCILNFD